MTDLIDLLQQNLELREKLIQEKQNCINILKEKEIILDKSIKNSERTVQILDILVISLNAMKKVMYNLPLDDPNRKILSDTFLEIQEKDGENA